MRLQRPRALGPLARPWRRWPARHARLSAPTPGPVPLRLLGARARPPSRRGHRASAQERVAPPRPSAQLPHGAARTGGSRHTPPLRPSVRGMHRSGARHSCVHGSSHVPGSPGAGATQLNGCAQPAAGHAPWSSVCAKEPGAMGGPAQAERDAAAASCRSPRVHRLMPGVPAGRTPSSTPSPEVRPAPGGRGPAPAAPGSAPDAARPPPRRGASPRRPPASPSPSRSR